MHFASPFTFLIILASLAAPVARAATPSATPGCSYGCATLDRGGYPNRASANTVSNGVVHCEYPTTSTSATGIYYCEYSTSTGTLTKAHDYYSDTGTKTAEDNVHYCPDAVRTCTGARRYVHADNLTAVLAKKAAAERSTPSAAGPAARADEPLALYGEDDRVAPYADADEAPLDALDPPAPPTPAARPTHRGYMKKHRMHRRSLADRLE